MPDLVAGAGRGARPGPPGLRARVALMAQPPKALTPHASGRHFLGAEIRRWREFRHLTAGELAGKVFASKAMVLKVETADRRASAELIQACDEALDTGGALGRLLDYLNHVDQTAQPVAMVLTIVTGGRRG
jgi:hypothetical protein